MRWYQALFTLFNIIFASVSFFLSTFAAEKREPTILLTNNITIMKHIFTLAAIFAAMSFAACTGNQTSNSTETDSICCDQPCEHQDSAVVADTAAIVEAATVIADSLAQ